MLFRSDADDELARGEVGKVGVPVGHRGDMAALLDGIPLGEMNTSMTINATAMWLLGMYVALADEQGVPHAELAGTTQNDILKEYLSRGTYIFPPEASKRLTVDLIRGAHHVEHRHRRREREGELLDRRRARLLQMIGADVHRVPFRRLARRKQDQILGQPQRRRRREDIGAA